jgi:hypothetical protein
LLSLSIDFGTAVLIVGPVHGQNLLPFPPVTVAPMALSLCDLLREPVVPKTKDPVETSTSSRQRTMEWRQRALGCIRSHPCPLESRPILLLGTSWFGSRFIFPRTWCAQGELQKIPSK